MIRQIEFTKMVASGNDFVVLEAGGLRESKTVKLKDLATRICDRKYGVGADGLLLLEKSKRADIRMRIFNPDGSEPAMCGNGVRCAALYGARNQKPVPRLRSGLALSEVEAPVPRLRSGLALSEVEVPETRNQKRLNIETKAGIIEAKINRGRVKIKMTEPKDIKLGLPVKIAPQARPIKVNFIDTGVPHAVIFVEGLDKIDIAAIGRQIRFYKMFRPQGTNVDFVQILDDNNIRVRTYERGVEGETLACGTGTVAAALLSAIRYTLSAIRKVNVHTRGGEILTVEFKRINDKFEDVWLSGKARIVHTGVYYV